MLGYKRQKIEKVDVQLENFSNAPRLADMAYEAIHDAIVSKSLQPGSKLLVRDLAQRLGISYTPVKEALVKLAGEGLVQIIPRKGAYVALLTIPDVVEIYELREVLEGLAAAKAAAVTTEDQLAKIAGYLNDGKLCIASGEVKRYSDVDILFHSAIAEASRNIRLLEALKKLQSQVRLLMATSASLSGRPQRSIQQHEQIYEAIKRRDSIGADNAAKCHVKEAREVIVSYLRTQDQMA
jgi:DNA-binding GntR family transcriptional regulator